MKVKQMKRNISKNEQLRSGIIATPYGSLVQTYLILNGIEWTDGEFIAKFRKAKFPFLEDKEFIQKTLKAVGLDYENLEDKPVALCGEENTIFCPFITSTTTFEIVLLPLFKDGRLLHSQELAMANDTYRIIDWGASRASKETVLTK